MVSHMQVEDWLTICKSSSFFCDIGFH